MKLLTPSEEVVKLYRVELMLFKLLIIPSHLLSSAEQSKSEILLELLLLAEKFYQLHSF